VTTPTGIESGIESFARLLTLRDGYTARHAERAADLAVAVGERLGLGEDAMDVLRRAARLHDIGKIGVPDSILRKQEPLDSEEWAVMRCHPAWGAEALASIPGFEETATVVRFHHERWDGRGYPDGLIADATPLESRIIGAAEAFSSMTADRPWRHALPLARARDLMQTSSGSHFDPDVVEALLAVVDERPDLARDAEAPPIPFGAGAEPATVAPPPGSGSGVPAGDDPSKRARPGPAPSRLPAAIAELRLPALAESRERLLRMVKDPSPKTGRIADLVETDPGLTAALLIAANASRRAGAAGGVASVPAGARLARARRGRPDRRGDAGLRLLPAGRRLARAARALPPARGRLPARRARLAAAIEHEDADELAVAALLHDVGKLVLAAAHDAWPRDVLGAARTPEERVRAERRVLGYDHATAGAAALERWKLPERVVEAVASHHDEGVGLEAAVVRLADMLAHYGSGAPVDPRALLANARELELDGDALRAAMFDLNAPSAGRPDRIEPSPLTDREKSSLQGLAEGLVYKDIAEKHGMSVSTVRTHLHNAYKKLEVADRAQAVLAATERGWI
jgi:putative nucleotidyltransferase with HDIG domain